MERRGFQFNLRAALLLLSGLSAPFALIRGGATLSAICLLYAAVVVPVCSELAHRQLRRLGADPPVKP